MIVANGLKAEVVRLIMPNQFAVGDQIFEGAFKNGAIASSALGKLDSKTLEIASHNARSRTPSASQQEAAFSIQLPVTAGVAPNKSQTLIS